MLGKGVLGEKKREGERKSVRGLRERERGGFKGRWWSRGEREREGERQRDGD